MNAEEARAWDAAAAFLESEGLADGGVSAHLRQHNPYRGDTPIIPSLGEVRADYIREHTHDFSVGRSQSYQRWFYGEKFDRSLAAHDAEKWDEGARAGHRLYAEPWSHISVRNPYRKVRS